MVPSRWRCTSALGMRWKASGAALTRNARIPPRRPRGGTNDMRRFGITLLVAFLPAGLASMTRAKAGATADLGLARAHWVDEDTLLWPAPVKPGARYALHHSPRG